MTPEQWLSLVIERAQELRTAGVSSISVDGAAVHLYPAEPAQFVPATAPVHLGQPADEPVLNPLDDPETFGGLLPGYTFPATSPGAIE